MKRYAIVAIIVMVAFISAAGVKQSYADDTCTFMMTANDIPPNIVILLDNGASMEEIVWHSDYDNSKNWTPSGAQDDVVEFGEGLNRGFLREKGYSIIITGNKYYLVEIPDNLIVADYQYRLQADGTGATPTWTINGRTITLPGRPSTSAVDGVIDKATNFRYSKNYLNWLFYGEYPYGAYPNNGSNLPNQSRFHFAKKALMTVAKLAANKANFSIYNFTSNSSGASNVQPLGLVVNTPLATNPANNTLDPNYVNNINNMGTVTYSPLAEGLATVGGYYGSSSSHVNGYYCQKSFAIVVSPGISSEDRAVAAGSSPTALSNYDSDEEGSIWQDDSSHQIPVNLNGTTYLDDVAAYLYENDIVDYQPGFQNVPTYTVGFMGDRLGNLFLINTSNNGNGNFNLYDTTHKEYAKYHFTAQSPDELSSTLLTAINDIISKTNSFTAPVVPVTRTTSGNKIYMAFFKPDKSNFWEGNVTKFGLSSTLQIVDKHGYEATWPNGAIKEEAEPFWQTKDWATSIPNDLRNIYTYLGSDPNLLGTGNAFNSSNITWDLLGGPTRTVDQIINYVRGADAFDMDNDGNTTENRNVITGDVLHSEPLVFHYRYPDNTIKSYVFFGSNDGMLHAVYDAFVDGSGNESNYGDEAWAFIPPDLLPRLKDMVEVVGHQYYVDSSPKVYFKDVNHNGIIESGDQVILVCGERKGGTSYFALDVTNPEAPRYLWRIAKSSSSVAPDAIILDLGESWSEPQYAVVKTSDTDSVGTAVFFIGGGYSSDNSSGKAILVIDATTGNVLKSFKNDASITSMNFSIASSVAVIDANDNGFVDKVYVGDLGGQLWRLGRFSTATGTALTFPDCDENIHNWQAQVIFVSDPSFTRKFYYPPSVTLEKGYDLLFLGTGDRENACSTSDIDRFYAIKDQHTSATYYENNLVNVTDPLEAKPALDSPSSDADSNGYVDQGWFLQLGAGEKVLAENTVFYKTVYFTTFMPNNDPCVPGGVGKIYAMNYKTSANVIDFNKDGTKDRSSAIGGGIPSKTVTVITDTLTKMLVSVGSTNPDATSQSFAAGVVTIDPLVPDLNFFYRWWRELTNL